MSCLNSSDPQHMIICNDLHHEHDECVRKEIIKADKALKPENFEILDDFEEEEKMYRVEQCGQAFHIYCVTFPDQIWRRWCDFMRYVFDIELYPLFQCLPFSDSLFLLFKINRFKYFNNN